MIKFSVVIPLYNKEKYIGQTIGSVLGQSFEDFELLVIDDGSTDSGPEIVKTYNDKRLKMYTQVNRGVSSARNAGLQHSCYDHIAFLDADDFWEKDFLLTVSELIRQNPGFGMWATNFRYLINGRYIKAKNNTPKNGIIDNYFRCRISGDAPFNSSSVCINKNVLNKLGGFNINERLGEDQDLWIRIALEYTIGYSEKVLSTYRITGNSASRITGTGIGAGNSARITDISTGHLHLKTAQEAIDLNKAPENLKNDIIDFIRKELLTLAIINLNKRQPDKARKILSDKRLKPEKISRLILLILSFLPYGIYNIIRNIKKW